MRVHVQQLKKHFSSTKAVDGINFSFGSGQIYGFVGPNGAGKTTTMRIMATLDQPTEGDVFIDGFSVTQEPEHARKLIGYVPDQEPGQRDIPVHEYLDFFARAYGLRSPQRQQVVHGIEEFTNLLGIRSKMLNSLSKGMKQRVSLARALIHDPPLLLLDEPAAGLDPRARIELRELLRVLTQRGKAILISSHILTELSEICDGAVIVERGRLLRAGGLHDILINDSPRQTVLIRSTERLPELHRALLQSPGVEEAQIVSKHVEAQIVGGDEACGRILAQLVRDGFVIVEFHQRKHNLERVFMDVTKGEVQ